MLRTLRVRTLGPVRLLALASLIPAAAWAQAGPSGDPEVRVYAYTLQYQSVNDALALVRPLLSSRGTVEIQPGGNTIVLRDSVAALNVIVPELRAFDHEPQPLRLHVQVVRAFQGASSAAGTDAVPLSTPGQLSPALVRRLRDLLRYDSYVLDADVRLDLREGEDALYELGTLYKVDFKLGTVVGDKRVKLHGFRIARRATSGAFAKPERELLGTNLNLWLDQTLILGLAKDEGAADALMLVLSASRPR